MDDRRGKRAKSLERADDDRGSSDTSGTITAKSRSRFHNIETAGSSIKAWTRGVPIEDTARKPPFEPSLIVHVKADELPAVAAQPIDQILGRFAIRKVDVRDVGEPILPAGHCASSLALKNLAHAVRRGFFHSTAASPSRLNYVRAP